MRSRSDAVTAAGEADYIEGDGTATPITANKIEQSWSAEERAAAEFVCQGCRVRVRPWNIASTKMSATFHATPVPHTPGCTRRRPTAEDTTDADGPHVALAGTNPGDIPDQLILIDRDLATPTDDTVDTPTPDDHETADESSERPIVPGGRSGHAHSLGRIVDAWLHLATSPAREANHLTIPNIDGDNYRYTFKRISTWNGRINPSLPRVFYASLRFNADPIADGDLLTITLQSHAPNKTRPLPAHLHIDQTGWPTGRRNALQRDLDWAYPHARQQWRTDKPPVTVFFAGHQHPSNTAAFTTTDQRLIYLTNEDITY